MRKLIVAAMIVMVCAPLALGNAQKLDPIKKRPDAVMKIDVKKEGPSQKFLAPKKGSKGKRRPLSLAAQEKIRSKQGSFSRLFPSIKKLVSADLFRRLQIILSPHRTGC